MLSVHYIIAFTFGLVTLFTATVLLFGTGRLRKLNLHLAGILALIGCICLVEAAIYSLYATKTYHLLRYYLPVDLVLSSALPPLLYAYIKKLLHYRFSVKSILLALAQLLPALAILVQMAVSDNDTRIRLSTWRIVISASGQAGFATLNGRYRLIGSSRPMIPTEKPPSSGFSGRVTNVPPVPRMETTPFSSSR